MHRWPAVLLALALAVAGCSQDGARPSTTSVVTPTTTPVVATTTQAPPSASWTPGCADPAADVAALERAFVAASALSPAPADPAAAAVRPLVVCQPAHVLGVRQAVKPESTALREQLDVLIKSLPLVLSGTDVAGMPLAQTTFAQAKPTLVAVLGEPDDMATITCQHSNGTWTALSWGAFTVWFDTSANQPLDSWRIRQGKVPANIHLFNQMPVSVNGNMVRRMNAATEIVALYSNKKAPWVAEPVRGITYVFTDLSTSVPSTQVIGGPTHTCE